MTVCAPIRTSRRELFDNLEADLSIISSILKRKQWYVGNMQQGLVFQAPLDYTNLNAKNHGDQQNPGKLHSIFQSLIICKHIYI